MDPADGMDGVDHEGGDTVEREGRSVQRHYAASMSGLTSRGAGPTTEGSAWTKWTMWTKRSLWKQRPNRVYGVPVFGVFGTVFVR